MDLLNYNSDSDQDNDQDNQNILSSEPILLSSSYSKISQITSNNHQNHSILSYSTAPLTLVPLGMSIIPLNSENQPISSLPDEMSGPNNPFKQRFGSKSVLTEAAAIDNYTFDEQYQNYQRSGYAIDSSSNAVIGNYQAFINETKSFKPKRKRPKTEISSKLDGINIDGEENGPWATMEKPIEPILPSIQSSTATTTILSSAKASVEKNPTNRIDTVGSEVEKEDSSDSKQYIVEPDEEDEKWERQTERKSSFILPPRPPRGSLAMTATTTFHGSSEKDFLGRSWITPPAGLRPSEGDHTCYIPKKCVKKFLGHNKGVNIVEFYPGTGHLMLSASLDGKCKIWDIYGDRNVRRTYLGHTEAIRSACFDSQGSQFLSSSFDRYMRLWDVETGQVKGTYSNRRMAYQVKFQPKDSNIFIAPCHDNRIYQWDVRTGNICQTYNHHLKSANAVVFFDDGRKFMSSSDDKKLLVWEYDIPVPITYISEPEMFSMPYLAEHPSGQFLVGQSMDNTIPVYNCSENVKPMKKRIFRGHNNSGYACQIGFSPNGKFMISGDGFGKLYFWDWKSMQLTRKFQAHENGPCIGAQWHPIHPSWVVTCGWDGIIKLWE